MDWMLPVGLVLYAGSSLLQIAEEWKTRGLTDTSFTSLALLIVGCGLIGASVMLRGHAWAELAVLAPAGVAVTLFAMKVRDNWRSKGLRFHRWR